MSHNVNPSGAWALCERRFSGGAQPTEALRARIYSTIGSEHRSRYFRLPRARQGERLSWTSTRSTNYWNCSAETASGSSAAGRLPRDGRFRCICSPPEGRRKPPRSWSVRARRLRDTAASCWISGTTKARRTSLPCSRRVLRRWKPGLTGWFPRFEGRRRGSLKSGKSPPFRRRRLRRPLRPLRPLGRGRQPRRGPWRQATTHSRNCSGPWNRLGRRRRCSRLRVRLARCRRRHRHRHRPEPPLRNRTRSRYCSSLPRLRLRGRRLLKLPRQAVASGT